MNRQKKVNIWDSMNFYVLQNYMTSLKRCGRAIWKKGKTHYKTALKALGFTRDGYDQYGAEAYSNGKVRVAVFYDRGEGYWDMEPASGKSDTTDDFYNSSSEMRDEYGNYGRGSYEDPWNW